MVDQPVKATDLADLAGKASHQVPADPVASDIPWALQADIEETAEGGGRRFTNLWTIGAALLALAFAVQYGRSHVEELVTRFPGARPVLCAVLACEDAERRDLEAVKILNRDVREHPGFRGALLINATLVNQARFRQPFPQLQLDLFDATGTAVGSRRFKPGEYLDPSVDIDEGMRPEVPFHIVLEVVAPIEQAISFEFRFL
jgi:hypothetical protein